jgi:hypothetical protein
MPTRPMAMADHLPRKPVMSSYYDGHSARDTTRRGHSNAWSGSQQSYNSSDYSDRRARYSRSSYHTGSSSSVNSSFHTSTSQPSPSSSSTSTASSLRTPPDLLLNGIASSLSIPLKGFTSVDGKLKGGSLADKPVHLSIHHLESRLQVSVQSAYGNSYPQADKLYFPLDIAPLSALQDAQLW